ncbi:MAG TPA: nucleotidyltransferase domain-containing protein [Spirochaetota bacterium]|nr:nucleotidyltransferase domain-containing protein [Spirochaetota bacterium]
MNEKDQRVLKQFADSVRKKFPEAEVWGFGSRVRGNASEYSDLDVCVVIENCNETSDRLIIDIAWETGFENDIVISTVTFSKKDFRQGAVSFSPFIKSIISSGVAA